MNGAENMGSIVQAIQALVTLAVGICSIIALTRKQPPIETEIAKLYEENKRDRETTGGVIRDHECRISRLEGRIKK